MNRDSGFYWIRTFHLGWIIAEYDKEVDRWYLTSGQIYRGSEIAEIDESMLIRNV